MVLKINNRDARRLWIDAQGLSRAPTGRLDLVEIIKALGFVQLDTIRAVSRAHHHILWSRNQNYREPMLWQALAKDRTVFEHFTHDASILPMEFYPVWQRQFLRLERTARKRMGRLDKKLHDHVKERIEAEGPLSTHAFDTKISGKKEMWKRPPHKLALDYLWYAGELATSHRESFKKFYDLSERIIPEDVRNQTLPDTAQLNWLCHQALSRLAFGSIGEIARFWGAAHPHEVKQWTTGVDAKFLSAEIENADGSWSQMLVPENIETRLKTAPRPTSRLRILNPFDPLIRDRIRLSRLFGFDYRIEIFVPAAKRKWGYYVYPLLEKDSFVGRIEVRADRKKNTLTVLQFWPEPDVRWNANKTHRLKVELARLARLAGVQNLVWECSI